MKDLMQFTNMYPVSKTLRFELKPVGETLTNIQKRGIIDTDMARAESYKKMKKTIDEFHKDFIDRALQGMELKNLDEFADLYTASQEEKRSPKWKEASSDCKLKLRKEIVARFETREEFKELDKKELIQKRLKAWIDATDPSLYYDEDFRNFTTYFTGYNQNRMNMYSEEEKATAVSHRLIDENLPKFLDNITVYRKLLDTEVSQNLKQLCEEMEPWINVTSLDDLFSIPYYNTLLTQSQIDAYNGIIGGRKEEDVKYRGINEYINLYNQTHPDGKLPKMKMLFKQILSDKGTISWLPEAFEDAGDLLDTVSGFASKMNDTTDKLVGILSEIARCDTEKIYIRGESLSRISNDLYGAYFIISDALGEDQKQDYYSLSSLVAAIDSFSSEEIPHVRGESVVSYFPERAKEQKKKLASAYEKICELLNTAHDKDYRLSQEDKDKLKEYLDTALEILHLAKPLYLPADSVLEKDELFYGSFTPVYEDDLQPMSKLYDMVRNYATKKPFSTEKVKLNFDCSTLLDGWDVNKEVQNLGVLFRKNGDYFLGIMDKKANHVMEQTPESTGGDCYSKVQYKLLPGPNKMLPKVFFSKSRIGEFAPSDEVMRIYRDGTFKKGAQFSLSDCHILIDFFKASISKHPEWSQFGFTFSPTEQYQEIGEFYREISEQAYKISFKAIPSEYIDGLVREGKLYLFRIHNKDFSQFSKGKPNLHTMYWKALFDEENLKDVVYKLNGQAEVFYRLGSIPEKERVVHPAGIPIAKKNPILEGQSSTFAYDICKDRRYTADKFQFHVPITMNYKISNYRGNYVNEKVCTYLKNNPEVNILGIDRGERHLLYISLIDRKGNVIQDENGRDIQYSLNTIRGEYRDKDGQNVRFETPYRELLDKKEKERESARQNWSTIENIKELKEGYLSQVVHHIASLMVKYNAIVVMEDLNGGFKRGRIKVEKQVYQKFEKALIDKLNYLVFKDADSKEAGGLYHALQLTDRFNGFNRLTKQSGFLFYVPAWNTSKIDPVTGFVDLLKPKYSTVSAAKEFFSRFDSIVYDPQNDYFKFCFDYSNFTDKAEGTRSVWTVCTVGGLRYAYDRTLSGGRGGYVRWNATERLKLLFNEYGIDYGTGELRDIITDRKESSFFAALIKNLQVVLAMRYSCPEEGKDFILSPVADKEGHFYCSEDRKQGLPQDADANGAYNIARKGAWVLEQIDRAEEYSGWTTKISNKEWLAFVQNEA